MLANVSVIVTTFFPVKMLNTRIDLSFSTIAIYFPLELIFILIGMELTDKSLRKSASILHEYFKLVGKSNV